jgi:hypothetical protein
LTGRGRHRAVEAEDAQHGARRRERGCGASGREREQEYGDAAERDVEPSEQGEQTISGAARGRAKGPHAVLPRSLM